MANSFINSTLLSKEAAAHFILNNTFFHTANHSYDGMFTDRTYDAGDTVNIRLKNFGKVQRGNTVTASDIVESSLPLTLQSLYSYPVTYTTDDLSTKLRADTWMDRVFYPGVDAIIGEINKDIAVSAALHTYNWFGTVGTPINSFTTIDSISAQMTELAIPMQHRYMALTPANSSALKSSLQNSFNTTLNTDISMQSKLGHLSTFDMFEEQLIATHTAYEAGPIGTPLVNGDVSSGNVIAMDGFTATITTIVKAGDIIEIADVYKVDPITKTNTGRLMQFVATLNASSSPAGELSFTVSPAIIGDSTNPNQNIVNSPAVATNVVPDNAVVTVVSSHRANLAYTNESLYIVTPPLAKLDTPESSTFRDPKTGISLRVSKSAEILDNKNVLRVDVLCGYLWIPSHTFRVIS